MPHALLRLRPAALAGCLLLATCARAPAPGLSSPDGRWLVGVDVSGGDFRYRIARDGHALVGPSPAGLVLGEPLAPLAIVSVRRERAQGQPASAAMRVRARETLGAHRLVDLEVRAFDAGAAFRLVLPRQPGLTHATIGRETTAFDFPADELCLAVHQDELSNSHEGSYVPTPSDRLKQKGYYDLPLVCRTGHGQETMALTESGIEDFAAAYFVALPAGRHGVGIKLTPHPDNKNVAVEAEVPAGGLATPWRVVMAADRPEALNGERLVDALAPPSRIGDAGWVKPGKAAWAWWSGMLAPGVPDAGHNDATYRRYIDFAARFGLPYYLIDRGWAWRGEKGDATIADVTRTAAGVNVPGLVRYARRRHVRLWLWVNWKAIDQRMEPAMALYERIGIAGIKVDYLYRQDQAMVAFYHRLLATAARHHLMVDVHAAFEPRGLDRTYPNFVTQEGVMGAEYNRWSRRVTASHDVWLAYARALIGPMDYSPGAFRNVAPAAFVPRNDAPEVMTTRAQQLAMTVTYPSPLLVLADAPVAYRGPDGHGWAPGADFLRAVPTTWDETRGIAGDFARWIAVARRHGDRWYVGVLNDEHARTVALPLGFLPAGRWRVSSWTDGARPDRVVERAGTVAGGGGRLVVPLGASGGAAFILVPDRRERSQR